MKKLLTITCVIAFALAGLTVFAQSTTVTGSKNYITKNINNVDAFKQLIVIGSPDVIYTQTSGSKPRIEIYGSDNIVPLIETEVADQTLTVRYKKNTNIRESGKLEVRVFAPAIESVGVRGSGDVELLNINTSKMNLSVQGSGDIDSKKMTCEELELSVQGSGDISLSNIKTNTLNVRVAGSGDVAINGTAVNANYTVAGSGDITASGMKAENVQANIAGSGDISCHAEKKLTGKVNGSGGVRYKGDPQISFSKKGLSKL